VSSSRYHRQTLLPGWGDHGQQRLAESHAIIVGVGALGCASADQLARAGVGRITLIDRDIVEIANLQRQTLFDERDAAAGTPKAEAAANRLHAINSTIEITPIVADFGPANAERLLRSHCRLPATSFPPILIDGTDNFETRYLLNDLAVKHALPYVYAGAVATRGMVMPVLTGEPGMPCLRCVFPEPPPPGTEQTCDTAGVLGPLIAITAGAQCAEAIKIMLGLRDRVQRSLLDFDVWEGRRRRIALQGLRDAACPCCVERRFDFLDAAVSGGSASLCGRDAVQITPRKAASIDLAAFADRMAPFGEVTRTRFLVRVVLTVEAVTLTVFHDARAIVQGVTDPGRARAVYDRYVGS
jgi:adenylyltransferase/sulfurtransferase